MSKINSIITQIDYVKINRNFDIVKVVNKNKKSTYYISDIPYSNALSVAFETEAVMYVLYPKGGYDSDTFSNEVGSKVYSHELISPKEIEKHMLIRLFMNRINNFLDNKLSFNNLAGKLFFYDLKSMKESGFTAYRVEIKKEKYVNDSLYLTISAQSFIHKTREEMEKFKNWQTLYTFSDVEHNFLRKAFKEENEGYIQKGFSTHPVKSVFMNLPKQDDLDNDKFDSSHKVYFYHHTIDLFNEQNKGYMQIAYNDVPSEKIGQLSKTKRIEQIVYEKATETTVNFINKVGEDEFTNLLVDNLSQIFKEVKVVKEPIQNELNLVLIHEKDYYDGKIDPHQEVDKSIPCQHLVYENIKMHSKIKEKKDGEIKYSPSLLNAIKELFIKYDILVNKSITIEDWTDRAYICDFSFSCVQDNYVYTLVIQPNGILNYKEPVLLDESEYKDYFIDSKADYLVISPAGDINTIKRTDVITIPSREAMLNSSRAKLILNTYYSGVFDLYVHKIDGDIYYSCGTDNWRYQQDIIKAVHLYKVNDFGNKNLYEDLMNLCAVSFINQQGPSVLPYPFKYLREYIAINAVEKEETESKE